MQLFSFYMVYLVLLSIIFLQNLDVGKGITNENKVLVKTYAISEIFHWTIRYWETFFIVKLVFRLVEALKD